MPAYYVETSALLKRYRREVGSHLVREFLDNKQDDEAFVTSHFTVLEVSAVVARWLRGRGLRRQFAQFTARFLHDLRDYGFEILSLDDVVVREANALLSDYPLRAPDALHFATAVRASGTAAADSYYVVCTDKEIGDACSRYGLAVLDPEHPEAL
ncbi:MAG: type II toxin-antitoxin system VapC family toxin [Chloroflexi bacterium]|nr:type II toxin-antitoxin system VapC family toxin [Chloroflexota bacterium]